MLKGGLIERFLNALQGWPPELLFVFLLVFCLGSVLVLYRFFGEAGLQGWVVVAILGANIQVLKAVKFAVYPEPVALGTVLFSSSFLATDILSEHYGPAAAKKAVMLGFASYLAFTVLMLLTVGFAPLDPAAAGEGMAWAVENHRHISALFVHSPALFLAGMSAYLLSQWHDVWLYDLLKRRFGGRRLWLRNNLSTAISALIDNFVFSILAWIVFAAEPLPWRTVLLVYVLGTYWLRLLVALADTPIIYLAGRLARRTPGAPDAVSS